MKVTKTLNGLDTTQLYQTVEAIKKQPEIAKFEFRAKNKWIGGAENRSEIRDFYGAGQEDSSRTEPFVLVSGEPPVLLGTNQGVNPVEFLLHSLAACITTTLVMHGTARGIRIEEISTRLEGDIDLQGFLGLDDSVSPGYEQIRVKVHIKADCSEEELNDLLEFSKEHSAVVRSLSRPVPVIVERAASVSAG